MSETLHDSTKSTHCCDVGALSLEPPRRQGMQRHRNDKSYLFLPNHRCKWRSFARVDLRAAMFSIPSCAWVDSSGRLFHDLSRKHAGKHVSRIMRETSWDVEQTKNRLAFLPKRRFKYNNGPNGHLFFVGGDLMTRRGMLPIIMLPDGDLCIVLHLVPFWILTIWGSVHIEDLWGNRGRVA